MPRWPADRTDAEAYPGPGYDLPLFYNDLDTNGHLNNVAIGRYFEHARFAGNIAAGLREAQRPTGSHFLVARVAIDYVSEGLYGTALHVRSRTARLGTSSVQLEQGAWQDGRLVGLADVTLVHLVDGAPAPLSDAIREVMGAMAVPLAP